MTQKLSDEEINKIYNYDDNTIWGYILDDFNKLKYGKRKYDIQTERNYEFVNNICKNSSLKNSWFCKEFDKEKNYNRCMSLYGEQKTDFDIDSYKIQNVNDYTSKNA